MAIRSRDFSNQPLPPPGVLLFPHPCCINSDLNGFETVLREIENATSVEEWHYLRPSLRGRLVLIFHINVTVKSTALINDNRRL